ncbi:Ribosomal RNA small subunit methyltransferase G [Pseudodesulfovibrio piezophilus C1TLV30]|uniref:Ribosomal RNA small subunit methyltransferase G n=2 Tax=Pseudodesulfovibrio TaxID=2035811 RepID=M1WXM2_PSEP2|nr:Ribosomal RNA small subunit methyltransferase G [Pseudodesulfovibrio piezophilus C1TLV30]
MPVRGAFIMPRMKAPFLHPSVQDFLDSCSKSPYCHAMPNANPTQMDVITAAKELGRPIFKSEARPLAAYLQQLTKWNRKMNLVGPCRWKDIFDTLVVDSLFLAHFLPSLPLTPNPLCLDLGAGAGLPGIPLRALWHDGSYWLIEVREKRALFMRSVLGKLSLPETYVFHGKAEDALEKLHQSGHAPTADLILSRAFMPWRQLLDFIHPMLSDNGVVVILANDPPPEKEALPQGWELTEVKSYPAAGSQRYFWSLSTL